MQRGDKLISTETIQYGATLERVINEAGCPYTLILVDDMEVWSCPTEEESRMIDQWKKKGRMIASIRIKK